MAVRSRTLCSVVVLVVAGLANVATQPDMDSDWRYPCDGQGDWDPAEPVHVHFAYERDLDPDIPGLLHGIRLLDPDGGELQLVAAGDDHGLITVCPVGGFAPETTYAWRIGPFHESSNHLQPPKWSGETETSFTTGDGWPDNPVAGAADCAALTPPSFEDDPCRIDTAWD